MAFDTDEYDRNVITRHWRCYGTTSINITSQMTLAVLWIGFNNENCINNIDSNTVRLPYLQRVRRRRTHLDGSQIDERRCSKTIGWIFQSSSRTVHPKTKGPNPIKSSCEHGSWNSSWGTFSASSGSTTAPRYQRKYRRQPFSFHAIGHCIPSPLRKDSVRLVLVY